MLVDRFYNLIMFALFLPLIYEKLHNTIKRTLYIKWRARVWNLILLKVGRKIGNWDIQFKYNFAYPLGDKLREQVGPWLIPGQSQYTRL